MARSLRVAIICLVISIVVVLVFFFVVFLVLILVSLVADEEIGGDGIRVIWLIEPRIYIAHAQSYASPALATA